MKKQQLGHIDKQKLSADKIAEIIRCSKLQIYALECESYCNIDECEELAKQIVEGDIYI